MLKRNLILVFFLLIFSGFFVFARNTPQNPESLFQEAYQAYQDKDYQKAIKLCRSSLARNKKHFDCCFLLARLYWEKNNVGATLKYLKEATKIKPQDFRPWLSLANIYKEKGQLEKAKIFFERALSCNPTSGVTIIGLANYYLRKKEYRKAISYAEKGIKYAPLETEGYYILGKAYLELDDREKALFYYNQLRELDLELGEKLLRGIKYKNYLGEKDPSPAH